MSDERILSKQGLVLDLKPKYLDWETLKFSGTINAEKGGWNSSTHYLSALESMVNWEKGIFKIITTNTTVPQREYEFFPGRSNTDETRINDSNVDGENAFERAIYNTYGMRTNKKLLKVGESDYKIITYQLPLVPKDGAAFKNIDLLAYEVASKHITIMELKKDRNTGDSPLFAIFESMVYFKVLHNNWKLFKKPLTERLIDYGLALPEDTPKYKILIMAPLDYWKHWGILKNDGVSDSGNMLKELANRIASDNELIIEFVSTKNNPVFCASNLSDRKLYRLNDDVSFSQL